MNDNSQQEEDVIDLKELFFSLLQHWYIILITTILALVVALFYLKTTLPVYSANAMLQIEDKSAGSDLLLGDLAGFDEKSKVQTEIEIIKSRMVLGEVARNLNLDISLRPILDSRLSRAFEKNKYLLINHDTAGVSYVDGDSQLKIRKFEVSDNLLDKSFTITILNPKEYQLTFTDENNPKIIKLQKGQLSKETISQGTIELELDFDNLTGKEFTVIKNGLLTSSGSLARQLSASEKGKGTGILALSMQGVHKEKITNTLNQIIDTYVEKNLEQKSAEKQKTLAFLDEQLPKLKNKLELSENKFNVFRDTNKTINVDKESQLLLEQSIQLGRTKLELEQKRAELGAVFTNEYPLLKKIDAQLDAVLKKQTQVSGRLKSLPTIQQRYLKLYRDVQINTELYTNLLNNYQQLQLAQSGEIGNIRVIDKAINPINPIKPKKSLIVLISLLLGSFIGVALVLLKKLLNSGLKDYKQLESMTGLPVLTNVPRSKVQKSMFMKSNKSEGAKLLYTRNTQDISIEALRSLRTSLMFLVNTSSTTAKGNVIMVTGASPGIGKSFISANLAAVMAESDKSVVIIDGDLRRGHLHKYYGQSKEVGVSEYVNHDDTALMKKTPVEGLKFISRGKDPKNPTNILMSDKFKKLIDEMSAQHDYVIIDSPPVLAVTDSTIIAKMADSTIVVTRYGVTKLPEVEITLDRLQVSGANIVGFVFNDIIKEAGSSYNYQYGYDYTSKS